MKFPKELVKLILLQEYSLPLQKKQRIPAEAAAKCRARARQRDADICDAMEVDRDRFKAGCQDFPETHAIVTLLNVAVTYVRWSPSRRL
ncbi:hypothetical protein [Bradyrhizobium sp. SBR1B]|uniref:hypothetical protein n=1 Tax=Bradyrhizobium sp. SBR1B TaxID=2663836 RepID=UPI001605C814|nr:hypothetical protein [Bradyrhizobium sp. SBR1B]MBB4383497.1 hypothetical protein [Bradyrhizobium sp. SBR1B]